MKEQGDLIVGVREEPTTPPPVARDAVPMVAESGKGIPAIAPNSGLERFIELTVFMFAISPCSSRLSWHRRACSKDARAAPLLFCL